MDSRETLDTAHYRDQFDPHVYPHSDRFISPVWNQRFTLLLAFVTTIIMTFTIFFAYNSSLEHPLSAGLIFDKPERSILALNILSQATIFCLAELTACVFEALRWGFASSASGTSAYTFLALSRATNIFGVIFLLFGKPAVPKPEKDGYRLWGGQRVLFIVLRMILGILLLSDLSFKSTYPSVHQFPIVKAGVSPMNTSVVQAKDFNLTATAEFWWYFPALLTDSKRVKAGTPLNCSGHNCNSYFIPGSMSNIDLDPNQPTITKQDYPKAISYIQNDAPGYQLDFYPIDRVNDVSMTLDDCRVYGVDIVAIQVCLKETGGSLLAAWNSCPFSVGTKHNCLNTTDWRIIVPFNTKVTISARRASTVFDRFNFTITDITDFSAPTPTNYTADDFFTFYDIVFAVNRSQTNWPQTAQYLFLLGISTYLGDPVPTQNGTGSADRHSKLREFLATPIFLFNNAVYGGVLKDMGRSVTLAIPSYRLIIAPYTLYSFLLGGFISLLWCFVVLIVVPLRIQTPSSSLYPEIDIASKIATEDSYKASPFAPTQSLAQLLWPLSNSESLGIRRRLALSRFFVRLSDNEYEGSRRVVLTLQENDMRLPKKGQASKTEMSTAYRTEELGDDSTTNYRAQYL